MPYYIKDIVVTGTKDAPQTIGWSFYSDYFTGERLPIAFLNNPYVEISSVDQDVKVYVTEILVYQCKIALSEAYDTDETVTIDMMVHCVDVITDYIPIFDDNGLVDIIQIDD